MSRQIFVRSFVGTAFLLAATSLAFAQHGGGHGGGHGGHGGGHGGHGGSHFGGHGGRHGGGHGGRHFGGHSGRHGGGHSFGGHGVGHGGSHFGGHGVGHVGGHGIGHGFGGHVGGHGGHGGHFDYGHGYPHFGFSVFPWYGGYGYGASYYSPAYYAGSYTTGYRAVEIVDATPVVVEQVQPVVNQPAADRPITTAEGEAFRRKAEEAFRTGDFQRAARMANHALVEMPRQGKLLLFTAQSLFAVGDYRNAAAAIHQATSQLDPQEWGFVVENYARYYRGRAYVEQMNRLSEYLTKNPDAGYAHFLRGYQHGFLGHQRSALRDLKRAFELESRDKLAGQLITRFGGEPPVATEQPALEVPPAIDSVPGPTLQEDSDDLSPEPTTAPDSATANENADGHDH